MTEQPERGPAATGLTGDDTLAPSEATDSDELHNDDGDDVFTPPDNWQEPELDEHESLETKLAAETADIPDTVSSEPHRPDRDSDEPVGGGRHRVGGGRHRA